MLNIKSGNAKGTNTASVTKEVINSITQEDIKLVIFFASTKYDFHQASKVFKESFSDIDVIGCTTAGEISSDGFSEGSISAMSIAADNFQTSTYVVRGIKNKTMLAKNDLIKTAEKIGITNADLSNSFVITLIDGLQASEEKVLNVLASCFNDLPLIGGSAGDDVRFKETFVSANGEVYNDAAVVTFVKSDKKFFIYKENIYVPTDIEFTVTKIDISKRAILELNGKPATEEYAKALGVPIEELPKHFMSNPLGRIIVDSVFITAPREVVDGTGIAFYSLALRDSTVKILKPIDAVAEAKNTVEEIKRNIPNCKGILLSNCILRYLQFKKENICSEIASQYAQCGAVCGFNTYGEQLNNLQVSQTLTLIALGE